MENEELIRKHFEQQLSEAEQELFETLMKKDTEFAREVIFQKNVKKAITLNERALLKKTLQSFDTKPKPVTFRPIYWFSAAVVVLFLGGLTWFQLQGSSTEKLYQQYYQSYPNVIAPTVRGENTTSISSEAFYQYDSGNYEKALDLFTKIYTEEKVDYALFYQALSLIELKRHEEAIASFEKFNASDNNAFSPFVKWYLALSYLKINQKEKAIVILTDLALKENPQQRMSQKLLEELK